VDYLGRRARRLKERERRLFLSWAKAGKDSEGRSKATRSEGDDLEESAARERESALKREKESLYFEKQREK